MANINNKKFLAAVFLVIRISDGGKLVINKLSEYYLSFKIAFDMRPKQMDLKSKTLLFI